LIGGMKWTSKGEEPKYYQTPYGEVEVLRHVYQTSAGGKTFCPLEREARIVVTSTPRFAKVVANKFARSGSTQVEPLRANLFATTLANRGVEVTTIRASRSSGQKVLPPALVW